MNPKPFKVGAVLFPGFDLLDIYGSLEMFGLLDDRVTISMFAQAPGEIESHYGPKGTADEALADAKDLDILIVPGGMGTRKEVHNTAFLEILKAKAAEARYVASVCTGSALLAKASILDGKKATSNKRAFDWVAEQGPKVNWIRKARWVEDGKFFTSSGISAGMDMTLGFIERAFDRKTALDVARRAEYLWNEDSASDPFAQ